MVKYLLIFICLLGCVSAILLAAPAIKNISDIKAKDVRFDGRKIILTGDVCIEGRLGTVHCDKAELLLPESDEKNKPATSSLALSPEKIFLQKNVILKLNDGSRLTADEADICCLSLESVFRATLPHKVVYIAYVEEEGSKIPVKTSCTSMRVKMQRDKESAYVLSDVQAEGAVTIEYQPSGKL